MSTPTSKTIKTKYGTYFVPLKQEDEFMRQLSISLQVDLLPSTKKREFNKTWGKYKVTVLPPKKK